MGCAPYGRYAHRSPANLDSSSALPPLATRARACDLAELELDRGLAAKMLTRTLSFDVDVDLGYRAVKSANARS